MRQLSGSNVYRVCPDPLEKEDNGGCTYWLQDDVPHLPDDHGDLAQRGTDAHELFEICSLHGEEKARERMAQLATKPWGGLLPLYFMHWRAWFKSKPMLPHHIWHMEIPIKYTLLTGVAEQLAKGEDGRRDYRGANPERDVTCTIDLVVDTQDSLEVIDYKTGQNIVPATDPQMLFMALAAAKLFGRNKVRATVVTVHQDGVWQDSIDLSPEHLARIHNSLCKSFGRSEKPNPGPYCRYCPAREGCPSNAPALAHMDYPGPFTLTPNIRSKELAVWSATAIPIAKDFIDRCETALKAYADAQESGGLTLPGNVEYAGKEMRKLKPKITADALNWLNQSGMGYAAIRFTTWEKLNEIAEKAGLDPKSVQDTFKKKGWVKEEVQRQYRTRKVKKK